MMLYFRRVQLPGHGLLFFVRLDPPQGVGCGVLSRPKSRFQMVDPFGSAKPCHQRQGKEAPLSVNPEHTPVLKTGSRRVDI